MDDQACILFLQWALPQLGMRWPGFRKVRGQVRKRLAGRLRELGLANLEAYRRMLREDPAEWDHLAGLCRNLVFTYFDAAGQRQLLNRMSRALHAHGALVIGSHESLPPDQSAFAPWFADLRIFRKNRQTSADRVERENSVR